MIILTITTDSEQKMERIAGILLKEKLAVDVSIQKTGERIVLSKGHLRKSPLYQVVAKTRSRYFQEIRDLLEIKLGPQAFEMHSVPLIHMDWDHANQFYEVSVN